MTKDNAIQIITGADGAPSFAAVPIETYRSMVRDLDAYRDLKTGMRELQAFDDGIAGIPADVAHRIADGENPVRVWRDHRGLKAVALARKAGISPAYLSEIETGKKEGTFRTMAALARHLEISLDDLAPLADDQDAVSVRRAGREAALKAEIAGIRATIASGAFDSGAVRGAVKRLKADMDALVADGAEPIWARDLASALEQIVQLVDQAESDIVETARSAQERLEEIMSFKVFSPGAHRRSATAPRDADGAATPLPSRQVAGE